MGMLEIEVKFFLKNIETVRQQLMQSGAESHGRIFENNICLDNADKNLLSSDSLLRLRHDVKTTLTYKTQPEIEDPEFKVLKEMEVEVSDFEMMLNILGNLGFHRTQVYEKYRETFSVGNATCCLDCMPFGDFLEIEGSKDDIRRLAQQIGMQWNRRILDNYRSIFDSIKQGLQLSFSDITFDNFSTVTFDIETFLPLFEAGTE